MSNSPQHQGSERRPPAQPSHRTKFGISRLTLAIVLALAGLGLVIFQGTLGKPAAAGAADLKTITAKALTSHECNDTEWHFVITQIDRRSDAPPTITVTWANGDTETISL